MTSLLLQGPTFASRVSYPPSLPRMGPLSPPAQGKWPRTSSHLSPDGRWGMVSLGHVPGAEMRDLRVGGAAPATSLASVAPLVRMSSTLPQGTPSYCILQGPWPRSCERCQVRWSRLMRTGSGEPKNVRSEATESPCAEIVVNIVIGELLHFCQISRPPDNSQYLSVQDVFRCTSRSTLPLLG